MPNRAMHPLNVWYTKSLQMALDQLVGLRLALASLAAFRSDRGHHRYTHMSLLLP